MFITSLSFLVILGVLQCDFVKISQNFIKSPLNFGLSHRFQSTVYDVYAEGHLNICSRRKNQTSTERKNLSSSLIRTHNVGFKNKSGEVHVNICGRHKNQTTFAG